jgi:membrane protease YdiL (CAAX protease family)
MSARLRSGSPSPERALLILTVYFATVFLGGALVAPWIHGAVGALARVVPALETLADYSFRRYVHRSILGLALLGLWPYARALGVRSWRELGVVGPRGHGRALAAGLAAGIGGIAIGTLLVVGAGARTLAADLTAGRLAGMAAVAVVSALVVALIEEVLFRGVLFGALRRAADWRWALLVTSAIYALVHFFGSPRAELPITWTSGLEILPSMLAGFVNVAELIPAATTLTVAGVALGLSFQRLGHLWFAIGLHAGWVLWVRSYSLVTRGLPDVDTRFWGGDIMIDGWLALVVMSLTLAGVLLWLPGGSRELSPPTPGDRR